MRPLSLVMLITVGGCWSPLRQTRVNYPGDAGRDLPPGVSATAEKPTVSRKVVNAKEEPVTLIAVDNTICRVSEKRFRETLLGEQVFCTWTTR